MKKIAVVEKFFESHHQQQIEAPHLVHEIYPARPAVCFGQLASLRTSEMVISIPRFSKNANKTERSPSIWKKKPWWA